MSRLMRPPRSPSLPSAADVCWWTRRESNPHLLGANQGSFGPSEVNPAVPLQSRSLAIASPVERRAHSGEDNGTRTRTPALTTRRLSLRLCPPQNGPRGGTRTSAGMVGSRGFEPRSARSERAASADCATSRDDLVPRGGLEPPPRGLRARYAPLTLQRGVELIPGIEFGRRPYQGRRLPLHQISSGANDGIRTRTSRLGRPVGDRYPTFALVRPTGIDPSRHAGNVECFLHTQAEHGPVLLTGPSTSFQFSKTPLMTSWWAARDSNPSAPLGENGVTARQRTIRSYRPLATAPGFEPGPTSFGGSDASVQPRCRCHLTCRPIRRHNLPLAWPILLPGLRPKQKRPSRGSPQKACFSMSADPLRRFAPLAAIRRAAMAIDPGLCHGSRHTPGQSRRSGAIR